MHPVFTLYLAAVAITAAAVVHAFWAPLRAALTLIGG
jgi:hypothetical protein